MCIYIHTYIVGILTRNIIETDLHTKHTYTCINKHLVRGGFKNTTTMSPAGGKRLPKETEGGFWELPPLYSL